MKLYVLIRNDLKKSHKAVQAGHAIARWLLCQDEDRWKNDTLVYLDINKQDLEHWKNILMENNLNFVEYSEPYYNNITTAIATFCDGSCLKDLQLSEF